MLYDSAILGGVPFERHSVLRVGQGPLYFLPIFLVFQILQEVAHDRVKFDRDQRRNLATVPLEDDGFLTVFHRVEHARQFSFRL